MSWFGNREESGMRLARWMTCTFIFQRNQQSSSEICKSEPPAGVICFCVGRHFGRCNGPGMTHHHDPKLSKRRRRSNGQRCALSWNGVLHLDLAVMLNLA